jgi:hypothetical protein
MFGTYRPMIGWASKRKADRIVGATANAIPATILSLLPGYDTGNTYAGPEVDRQLTRAEVGQPLGGPRLQLASLSDGSFLLPALAKQLLERRGKSNPPQTVDEWREVVGGDALRQVYGTADGGDSGVVLEWRRWARDFVADQMASCVQRAGESLADFNKRRQIFGAEMVATTYDVLDRESRLAAAIQGLVDVAATAALTQLFYRPAPSAEALQSKLQAIQERLSNPFLQFDPTNGLTGASVSPIGIVHLFRQYFFEFDTFLGPAVGHVWLTPGSVVELVESSTRKTTVERTIETEYETTTKTESEDKRQEDISDSVKEDNRNDTKLGFGTTVNQSWGTGNLTATASINLDRTQQQAREHTQKRMREQTDKISTETRNSYKTTFRTVTESTDVSSKRYVLENKSETDLQNYEMRRKMRQVGVQVQDIGSYLCWETYVDDPGGTLGLANLVHIAKPPDITPLPDPTLIPIPERKPDIPFDVKVAWGAPKNRCYNSTPQGVPLGRRQIAVEIPDGYVLDLTVGQTLDMTCSAASGEGADGFLPGRYLAVYQGGRDIDVGYQVGAGGLDWDEFVSLELRGSVALVPDPARVQAIKTQNDAAVSKANDAQRENERKASEAAFYAAAKERIEIAASVKKRLFEDLREEERTLVYRALIADLMATDAKSGDPNYQIATDQQRHLYATVINAIFDIDKLLYFVAPEWWKPRSHSKLRLGANISGENMAIPGDKTVSWSDKAERDDNYYITANSEPARLGSSLGWLLQLDGDDNRNRFLNAPWVRAVIPIRPGMEEAAIHWLQAADVEGAQGLADQYAAVGGEAEEIANGLAAVGLACDDPPTVGDAIRYLCVRLKDKHQEGSTESLFPDRDGIDDEDKVWSTPIDKVYEHGFYPLERSFRANPVEPPADSHSPNFQIMAQWTEILPTDQIVPIAVDYNPVTGRMIEK